MDDELRALLGSGVMYDDLDPVLIADRQAAVLATTRYNDSFGAPQGEREALLRTFLGAVGEGVHFEPTLRCEFGSNIAVGDRLYANFDCVLLDGAPITIGDDVLFGPRVGIYTSDHAIDAGERVAGGCVARPVTIEDAVWVGGGVTITGGVTIGRGSVIGAGSVVTRSVPAGVVAVGVPARVLRPITEADRTGFTSR